MLPTPAPPFRVKICGITRPVDARAAVAAGADAIGLNFVVGSPRCLTTEQGAAVVADLPRAVLRVGVFVGTLAEEIRRVVGAVGLDAVQLHGHWPAETLATADPPGVCAALAGIPVIRATRLSTGVGGAALDGARDWVADAVALGHGPVLVLVDASPPPGAAAAALGGSGRTVDWRALRAAGGLPVPIGVAGGLHPDNVARAITESGAVTVDTASGVESAPGIKDAATMHRFVAAAREALFRSRT
jgi:phosphoribosylanthranilate isomerase